MTETWTLEQFKAYNEKGIMPKMPETSVSAEFHKPELPEWVKAKLKEAKGLESDLQTACENWMSLQGCLRMTSNMAEWAWEHRDAPLSDSRVWYGHLRDSKKTLQGNVFMPDLFVWTPGRPVFLAELKTRNIWKKGQLEMVCMGIWKLACTLEQFQELYREWEDAGNQG